MEIIHNLLTTDTKQRTDDMAVTGSDASETMNAGTSQEIHQQSLNSIVAVMSNADRRSTNILTKLFKIMVSQFSCSHFNAYLM